MAESKYKIKNGKINMANLNNPCTQIPISNKTKLVLISDLPYWLCHSYLKFGFSDPENSGVQTFDLICKLRSTARIGADGLFEIAVRRG